MYVQRTQSLNIQIDDEQAAGGTNWNNVQSRLRDLFRPNPRVGQQKQNILQTLVGQFAALPSDEDSFANRSQIQASTPVISTPKNGSVHLASHMKLPRISAIPRTPLRSVSSLANVSTRPENVSIKRKSTSSTPKASAKKIKTNKSIETVHKTPKSALHFIEQFSNMESPYNSPLTPNTIKNLNHQQSLYRTYQQSRMTVNQSMFPNRTTSVAPMEDTSVQTSFSPKTNVNRPYEEVQESRRRNVTSSTVVQEQPAVQLENTVNVSKNRVKHATTLVDYDETMPSFNNGLADDNSAHDVSSHPDDLLSEDEQEKKDEEEEEKEEGGSSDEEEEEGEDGQSVSAEEEEKEEDNQSVSSEEEEKEEDNQSVSSEEEEEAEVTSNKAAAAAARRTLVNSGYLTDDSEEEEEQQEEVEDTGNKAAAAARRTLVNSGYLTDDSEEESSSSSSDDDDDEDEAEEEEEEEEEEESEIKPNASRATKAGLVNSGYLSENTASSPLPLTTNIVRVQDSSDSFSREEKFVHEEVTPRPEDFFGIYAEADDDDDELQQESRMPPSSYKSSLSRPSSLSGSSSRLNLKAKSARKSAVMSDSSDEEEEEDDHHHHHHNSGYQSPVYSSPVEDPAEEEEEEHEEEEDEEDHHDHHRPMSPASASSHSDNHSDEEQEEESELEEEEEEEEAKPLPRGGSSSRRPKHSKDSLKRRIAKHLDEHSAVIRPSDTTFDCRRSKRNRVRPVNYWAGERPLYQKSITKDGNCVSTLVGVSSVRRIEPTRIGRKRTASAAAKSRKSKGKEAEVSAAQKMENILNLSIHKKKLANATADSSRADPEHVRAFAELDFTESKNSQGVFTVMTKREDKIALGKLKFNPRAKKVPTKTGNYVTHFNVVYGTLLLKVNNDKVGSIIKSGFYVNVDSQTTYSIENLRNDQAVLDFTIIQKP